MGRNGNGKTGGRGSFAGMTAVSIVVTLMPLYSVVLACLGFKDGFRQPDYVLIGLAAAIFATWLAIRKPVRQKRIKNRERTQYDEFGRSKRKTYENISREERDAIELQKLADTERVLNSVELKKMTKQGSINPERDMESLVAMDKVKEKMEEMAARMKFENEINDGKKKKRGESRGSGNSLSGRHAVFYGAPGTGKTTVARILTGFLYKYGYIEQNKCVEIDGNYLKAGGNTALKTSMVIRHAYGGVLFIDEAYSLAMAADGSGGEAVATIIKEMEDSRDRLTIILAGYTEEMRMLLEMNPGLESRIRTFVFFPDYSDYELCRIFEIMAAERGFSVSPSSYVPFLKRIAEERQYRAFGNARTVRNLLDEAIDVHAVNYMKGLVSPEEKMALGAADVPETA